MSKFRKKPVVIEAVQFRAGEQPHELVPDVINGNVRYPEDGTMLIRTLEGEMCAQPGDWIIRGVKGELYPCKPDIFGATYEPAPEAENCADCAAPHAEEHWDDYTSNGPGPAIRKTVLHLCADCADARRERSVL